MLRQNPNQQRMERTNNVPIATIVNNIRNANRGARLQLPPVSKYQDTTLAGRRKLQAVTGQLGAELELAMGTTYQRIDRERTLFKMQGDDPYTVFTGRNDLINLVMYGTQTDRAATRRYDTAVHSASTEFIVERLRNFTRLLSALPEGKGLDIAMRNVTNNAAYLNEAQAIVSATVTHGS